MQWFLDVLKVRRRHHRYASGTFSPVFAQGGVLVDVR